MLLPSPVLWRRFSFLSKKTKNNPPPPPPTAVHLHPPWKQTSERRFREELYSPRQTGVGLEWSVHSWSWPRGVDRQTAVPLLLEHSALEEELEFPWSLLVGKYGILHVAWAPRTLFMVLGPFEAELEPITVFMVKSKRV